MAGRDVERCGDLKPFYTVGKSENEKFPMEKDPFRAVKCKFEAGGEAQMVDVYDIELNIKAVCLPRYGIVREFQVYTFLEACSEP